MPEAKPAGRPRQLQDRRPDKIRKRQELDTYLHDDLANGSTISSDIEENTNGAGHLSEIEEILVDSETVKNTSRLGGILQSD